MNKLKITVEEGKIGRKKMMRKEKTIEENKIFIKFVSKTNKSLKMKIKNIFGKEAFITLLMLQFIFASLFIAINQAHGQELNENCTVSVLNRTANVQPDGSWTLPNAPSNMGQVRARATCVDTENGVTISGQSDFFTVTVNGITNAGEIKFGNDFAHVPVSLGITSDKLTLNSAGDTAQLTIIATYPDSTTAGITAGSTGTSYIISNPAIATISADGLVTAVASGTVIVAASNEMVLSSISISVQLSGDSDGDGLPDDFELANGLNPNNPIDALEDMDTDGLTNLEEFNLGTGVNNADTDGDGIEDGEEVVAGGDGFITNPLSGDSDGDGIWDGLEVSSGTDPNDSGSFDLAATLNYIEVTPSNFVIVFNTIMGEATQRLTVVGTMLDGRTIDLTPTGMGTNYSSSDLAVANFGLTDGLVYAGTDGTATITITNNGFSDTAVATVQTFSPTAISYVDIPGLANNVDVSGDFAYVAAESAGLQIIDVSDRNNPAVVASIDTTGNANDVKVAGNTAFIADGSSGLQIIDITNPLTQFILGSVDTPGDAQDVVVEGNLAYVADGLSGLQVIDISIPTLPIIVGSVDTPGNAYGVDVDQVASLAVVADRGQGIQVIDISVAANPAIVGSVNTGDAWDVALRNNFAFVADYSSSFTSVDISVPANPIVRASTPSATGGLLNDVVLSGQFAFGSDIFFVNGVPIIDISAPGNPIPRSILDFGSIRDDNGTGIAVDSNYVYLTAAKGSSARLYIGQYIDITDTAGIAPTVNITAPVDGDTVVEGITLPITVNAVDDVAVAAVDFMIDGVVVFTDTSIPYRFDYTVPAGITGFTISTTAIDLAGNIGTSSDVVVNVEPDPLTRVIGRVVDVNGDPMAGATVITSGGVSMTTGTDGVFDFDGISTILGDIVVNATVNVSGVAYIGVSLGIPAVPGGTTDVGDVTMVEVYINNGLVADYPFNRNANDESGNGNHGVVKGATLTTDRFGNIDRAYSFDGGNDYITVSIDVSESSYTTSFWFKTSNVGRGIFAVVQPLGPSAGHHDRHIYLDSNGNICTRVWNNETICTSGKNYADDTYYHVVHVLDGNNQKIYVNGEIRATGNKGVSDFNWDEGIIIGFSYDADNDYFAGELDDIRVYNRALTELEIEILFNNIIPDPLTTVIGTVIDNNGSPLEGATVSTVNGLSSTTLSDGSFSIPNVPTIFGDIQVTATFTDIDGTTYSGVSTPVPSVQDGITDVDDVTVVEDGLVIYYPFNGNANDESGNGNYGIVNSATLTTDRFGNVDRAYSFDGDNDYIISSISNLPLDDTPRTITAWVKGNVLNDIWGLVHYGQGDCTGKMFGLSIQSGKLGHWGGCKDAQSDFDFPLDQWTFIAVVYDGNTITIWMNDQSYTIASSGYNTQDSNFFIGSETTNNGISFNNYFNGLIDDIRLYNRALTESEITPLYNTDLFTTVTGRAVDVNGNPISGATVIFDDSLTDTTDSFGIFTINNVPTILGDIVVEAIADVSGMVFFGKSVGVPAVLDGTTDIGDVAMVEVYLDNGLVANYPFNGNANDESGNGNDGIVNGATLTMDRLGNTNNAYSFDGVDDYIKASANNLPIGDTPRTITAWVKGNVLNDIWGFIHYGQGNCAGKMFGLSIQSGKLGHWGGCKDAQSDFDFPLDQWTFIAVVYDGNTITFWMNDQSYTITSSGYNTQDSNFFIGSETTDNGISFGSFFNGLIDDVRLYNRALTGSEIRVLYIINIILPDPLVTVTDIDENSIVGATNGGECGFDIANISAYGAAGQIGNGGAGTIYLKSSLQTYGDLIVDNNGITTTDYSTPLVSVGIGTSTNITADTLTDSTRRVKDGNGIIDEGRVKREDGRVKRVDGRGVRGEGGWKRGDGRVRRDDGREVRGEGRVTKDEAADSAQNTAKVDLEAEEVSG